jgi:hypothetical protein
LDEALAPIAVHRLRRRWIASAARYFIQDRKNKERR